MRVNTRGIIHNLPTIRQAIGGTTDKLESKVNCISVKAFKRPVRKRKIKEHTVFLGLIQKVQKFTEQVDVAKKYKGKSDLQAVMCGESICHNALKKFSRSTMTSSYKTCLQDYLL